MESAPVGLTCTCGVPAVLYWLKDEVWALAAPAAPPPQRGGHLCLDCAAKAIGRPLTLYDLQIANYHRTPKSPNDPLFMTLYTRATIIGGYWAIRLPLPESWAFPCGQLHMDAMKIGEQLARQTADEAAVLPLLAAKVDRFFPFPR